MRVSSILNTKGRDVICVAPDNTIAEAIAILTRHRISAVVVGGAAQIDGIFSERDVIYALAEEGESVLGEPVSSYMTAEVISCEPDDDLTAVMRTMTERRIRHLPVLEQGVLAGILSIGDMVKHRLGELENDAEALREYIAQA